MKTLLVLLVAVLALAAAHGHAYGGYGYYGDENNDGIPDKHDVDRNGRPDSFDKYYGKIPYGLPTYGAPIPYVYGAGYGFGYGYGHGHGHGQGHDD